MGDSTMNEQQLFIVRNIHTGVLYGKADIHAYEGKGNAKLKRDELNGGLSTEDDKKWNKDAGWRVTYGPDHWRYKAND
jgi:hypothetical protein